MAKFTTRFRGESTEETYGDGRPAEGEDVIFQVRVEVADLKLCILTNAKNSKWQLRKENKDKYIFFAGTASLFK